MIDAQSFLGPDASEIFGERTRPRVQRLTPRQPQPGAPPRSTENITSFNKNTSMDNQPWSAVTNCQLDFYVNSAHGQTIQSSPKVHCINYYPSTGCKKIYPNIGQYTVFDTPGGTPLFYHPPDAANRCKPLSRNDFHNSELKITPSKLPRFSPKNTQFLCSVEPVARLWPVAMDSQLLLLSTVMLSVYSAIRNPHSAITLTAASPACPAQAFAQDGANPVKCRQPPSSAVKGFYD